MMWAWWWYMLAAFALFDHSINHDVHKLGLAVIFVVIGTGQRIVSKIEKRQK